MINIDFKTYGRLAGAFIKNNSQVILAASALVGVISTAITSSKAHVKAMDILREEFPEGGYKFTDALRLTWTCYMPAAISITATSAAIIGGTVLSERRYAAMAAAYTVSQDVLEKYEDRVKELTGKKGSDTRSAIARDVIEENLERPENKSVIITGENVLISDSYSGRVFPSTITKVQKVLNQINSDLINGISSVSLNELYQCLGLEQISMGDELGWSNGTTIEAEFTPTMLADESPALLMAFNPAPVTDWFRHQY